MSKSDELTFGIHAVRALLEQDSKRLKEVIFAKERRDKRLQNLVDLAREHQVRVRFLDRNGFDRQLKNHQLEQAAHQGVLAYCTPVATGSESDLAALLEQLDSPAFLLILDGVTDPHNLGACLRTADASGVHAVIAPKDKSATLNATAVKVACGAAETVPFIQVTNLARTMKELQQKGIWITGTTGDTDVELYQADLTGPMALVMGAEGQGMRRLTTENCDALIRIPMAGSVSSLNVSVATGVCLYEAVRQRQTTSQG